MDTYDQDEIDITKWELKPGDHFLISMKKIDRELWKGELYKSYGLYYVKFFKESDIKNLLNLGWGLVQK